MKAFTIRPIEQRIQPFLARFDASGKIGCISGRVLPIIPQPQPAVKAHDEAIVAKTHADESVRVVGSLANESLVSRSRNTRKVRIGK